MTEKRWKTSIGCVYNIGYHIIFCTKYRRLVLEPSVEKRLKELIQEKALKIGVDIVGMETMPDHVHIFVKASPTLAPHYIVQQFKGFSSRYLRKEFKHIRTRLPSLWTRSYYCESVGYVSEQNIKKYIEDQKKV